MTPAVTHTSGVDFHPAIKERTTISMRSSPGLAQRAVDGSRICAIIPRDQTRDGAIHPSPRESFGSLLCLNDSALVSSSIELAGFFASVLTLYILHDPRT